MDRIAVGHFVAERLKSTSGALKLPSSYLDIFVVRDFLSPKECEGLIKRIDAHRQPSGVLGDYPDNDPDYRTSESCNMNPMDPLVIGVEQKIATLMGINPENGETIQGQRYAVGQQFKPHHDFFYTDQPYWADMERTGGQRTWTAMMFLNAPEAGGQTAFPEANLKVTPRAGNLLAWNNLDATGAPNMHSLHQGMPVEAGVKYVITKWYRESPWTSL
ncbi:MAG TPA: 2OG-Fe(II) oxygenase [Allosphingosinicella sp.]|uniref:prolyl hydroxylase family protein n=1 Tax=Allosphingosinicella sp. TaxID=2823234 RepID=UPI002ED7C1CF